MVHLLNNIQRNSVQNFWPDFHLQQDNDLHSIEWSKLTCKSILQHPSNIMSFFRQRKSDIKGLYPFIGNNTGFQICVELKVWLKHNRLYCWGVFLQRCYIYKNYYNVSSADRNFMDMQVYSHGHSEKNGTSN